MKWLKRWRDESLECFLASAVLLKILTPSYPVFEVLSGSTGAGPKQDLYVELSSDWSAQPGDIWPQLDTDWVFTKAAGPCGQRT